MAKNSDFIVLRDRDAIIRTIEDKSQTMTEIIKNGTKSVFCMYYKYLTHSDLPTFGKATRTDKHEDNLLYYLSVKEMIDIELRECRPFETTHQSNIGMQKDFWTDLGMMNPRETVNFDIDEKRIDNFANVYLVNDTLRYFCSYYTHRIFKKMHKSLKTHQSNEFNSNKIDLNLDEGPLTKIKLTQAVHGIGISTDIQFSKLRHHMFKNDILFLIIEKNSKGKNLYIIPVKNPRFFTLIGETNEIWEQYKHLENQKIQRSASLLGYNQEEAFVRQYQDRWRNQLAEEMMNFTTKDREVFCPVTYISANFDTVGTLFRASHIKSYSDSNMDEKYDLNNGLLLVANADALFDKHLISISENKQLLYSFLIEQDALLKQKLLINQDIFKEVLNDERMRYIAVHRQIFFFKEEERKRR
ncbi:MAG: HNH endonuclease signature motif containing protein [Acholeplasma sp.]|nr:HNH endonuclease signature motif containing protein [Acholeplasma sp.]